MGLNNKIRLSILLQYLTTILSGTIILAVYSNVALSLLGIVHFILWGICYRYGAYLRDLICKSFGRLNSEITPSWSSALILSLVITGILFKVSEINDAKAWLNVILAINIIYFGAKYKCYVYRCCEVRKINRAKYILKRWRLPVFEMIVTLLIIFLSAIAMIFGQELNKTSVMIIFTCHILLRYYCSLLRFSNRTLLKSMTDYTILLPIILFAFLLWQ